MARRTFTPREVQALIPTLELIFGRLMLVMREARATRVRIGSAVDGEPIAGLEAQLEKLLDEARTLVGRLQATGAQVKDLERGLVDFPCWRKGQVVLLCWQFGERRLAWWHREDEGFAGRKPLETGKPERTELLN